MYFLMFSFVDYSCNASNLKIGVYPRRNQPSKMPFFERLSVFEVCVYVYPYSKNRKVFSYSENGKSFLGIRMFYFHIIHLQ